MSRIARQLVRLLRAPAPPQRRDLYPRQRNLILDILEEGRRKPLIHLLTEVDLTDIRPRLRGNASLTAYVAKTFADAVAARPLMQAYRQGRRGRVVFAEVDLAVMVERDLDGEPMPVPFVLRRCEAMELAVVQAALRQARYAPLGEDGPWSALESWFFTWPRALRRILWWWMRRDPSLFKAFAGTVGLTSMGMFSRGGALVLPVTPMTLTLSVGGIAPRVVLREGRPVEAACLQLGLSADHRLIDGAPLMRFAQGLRERLERGEVLQRGERGGR